MNPSDINVFNYFVNSAAMLVMLLVFLGVTYRLSLMAMAILAYPIYLALYYFEFMGKKMSGKRHFFVLNLPDENPKRLIMNFCASMVSLLMLPNLLKIYLALNMGVEAQTNAISDLLLGDDDIQMWGNSLMIAFVFVVYGISYFTKIDERHTITKIQDLTVPSLWKSVIK